MLIKNIGLFGVNLTRFHSEEPGIDIRSHYRRQFILYKRPVGTRDKDLSRVHSGQQTYPSAFIKLREYVIQKQDGGGLGLILYDL